jgi:cell division protein FtsW
MVLQAIIHMGVNVHLLPNTGITLPLVSWGGSSIWFNAMALGIILSVSRHTEERTIVAKSSKKEKQKIVDEIHG